MHGFIRARVLTCYVYAWLTCMIVGMYACTHEHVVLYVAREMHGLHYE